MQGGYTLHHLQIRIQYSTIQKRAIKKNETLTSRAAHSSEFMLSAHAFDISELAKSGIDWDGGIDRGEDGSEASGGEILSPREQARELMSTFIKS